MEMKLKPLVQPLMEVFFPRSCVHCQSGVEGSDYAFLCRSCSRELFLSKSPTCTTCGYPFFGMIAGPKICPHCAELDPLFDGERPFSWRKGWRAL